MNNSDNIVLRHATDQQLDHAIALNHQQLFTSTTAAAGGEIVSSDGLCYTYMAGDANIPFPSFSETDIRARLDAMIDYYRSRNAQHIGCWSLYPSTPPDLGAYLLARGFQHGWRPRMMSIDLDTMQEEEILPLGLEIKAENDIAVQDVKDLPYGTAASQILFREHPEIAQRFVAFQDGVLAGHCALIFTTGPLGIAGMYNVGVLPWMQKRGIGRALVLAACRFAKEKGYQYVMLNANDMGWPVYTKAGFRVVSYGRTWWLMGDKYITHPPSAAIVTIAEAVGRGDMETLRKMDGVLTTDMLNQPTSNGMTLLAFASYFSQPEAAEWLIQQGARCSALDAWDLGWRERAAELLAADPAEANRRYYDWNGTLMHVAVERNDIALAKLALAAGTDLSIADTAHDSNALGWAYYFQRKELIQLIEGYEV